MTCIQIYAKRSNGGFILTDDGSTIDDLELSGCKLSSPKRQSLLRMTLNGFGVHNENNVLQVRASNNDFALRKHNLLQAMLAVNDLFYLATPMVASLFLEDVEAWLRLSDIRFISNVKLSGKSGYDHLYNFVIPGSRIYPERVLAKHQQSEPRHSAAGSLRLVRHERNTFSRFPRLRNPE